MTLFHPNADAVAMKYLSTDTPPKELGWGIDGVVYSSPSTSTAVKVHTYREKFQNELRVYQRLVLHHVTEFEGFAVPRLVRHDDELQVIEMSIVRPPFLLDFAGASLDRPRMFEDGTDEDWWARVLDSFGNDFAVAQSVYWGLVNRFGIYYYDLKPGNLQFR